MFEAVDVKFSSIKIDSSVTLFCPIDTFVKIPKFIVESEVKPKISSCVSPGRFLAQNFVLLSFEPKIKLKKKYILLIIIYKNPSQVYDLTDAILTSILLGHVPVLTMLILYQN